MTTKRSEEELPPPNGSAMCHFKDSSDKTIREIMRWSIMECSDPELTDEIQRLGTKIKLAISRQPNSNSAGAKSPDANC